MQTKAKLNREANTPDLLERESNNQSLIKSKTIELKTSSYTVKIDTQIIKEVGGKGKVSRETKELKQESCTEWSYIDPNRIDKNHVSNPVSLCWIPYFIVSLVIFIVADARVVTPEFQWPKSIALPLEWLLGMFKSEKLNNDQSFYETDTSTLCVPNPSNLKKMKKGLKKTKSSVVVTFYIGK